MGFRVVFLDRDGTLNLHRSDYVKTIHELQLLPDIHHYLKKLRNLGYMLVIVTNQSAINRGLTTVEEVNNIHNVLLKEIAKQGCTIDAIYYCPHRPDENCDCRKPRPGLLLKAAREHDIDLPRSWVIGDNDSDIEAGRILGCKGIKIPTNGSLAEAVRIIRKEH